MAEVLPNRIMGTEMEWGIAAPSGSNITRPYEAANGNEDGLCLLNTTELSPYVQQYLNEADIKFMGSRDACWLRNGARFYADVGFREYATPEDNTLVGTTAGEIAGERIMRGIVDLYENDHDGKSISLNKRVIDDKGNTWGYHQNFCSEVDSVQINADSLALYGTFAAVRSVLFGAGHLRTDGTFHIAQKVQDVAEDFNKNTTSNKPLVNLRNEELADKNKWCRIHDTSGDPNMSPWVTMMKLGTGSLVLRLIEHDRKLEDLRFNQDLPYVAKSIAKDVSLSESYRLRNGERVTATEVLRRIYAASRELSNDVVLPEEELWTIDQGVKAVADLEQDRRLLKDRSDWVLKLAMLNRMHDKHGHAWDSPELLQKERQWSEIGKTGIGLALRERDDWARWMPPESLISKRVNIAPPTTRAHLRGEFVEHFSNSVADASINNWLHLKYGFTTILLTDPTASYDKHLQALIDRATATNKKASLQRLHDSLSAGVSAQKCSEDLPDSLVS